jgi:hypothetical protein
MILEGTPTWLTSTLTCLIQAALSATYMQLLLWGSMITSKILDGRLIGEPFLFPDFAARRARVASEALFES